MSKLAETVGKKSFAVAASIDILGILVSLLIDVNVTNTTLAKIIFLSYCVRYELIWTLFFLILGYIYAQILIKHPQNRRQLIWVLFIPLVIALGISYPRLKRYAIARYFYVDRELYQFEAQKAYLNKAIDCYNNQHWEESVTYIQKAQELYPDNRYARRIGNKIVNNVTFVQSYADKLYDIYIKPTEPVISYESFHCARTISNACPQKYQLLFDEYFAKLQDAISAYPQLYEAVQANDYAQCHELIMANGWCWFEPKLYEIFSYDKEKYVMPRLHQYIEEDSKTGMERMENYWLGIDHDIEYKDYYEAYARERNTHRND